ncbi:hypothetical protein GGTG_06022 [Gaeumannomyces tritici R3-111a-1]|uniref:Uncharacterized protein n=1 Tax=Gaeumannomyces tritici (strain R3-111a-1) TaxID=644352 RepID=J3NXL6_GAET3|nr:hypothetical protein GGTG_06022 [Gaeumannomyces tritici R3-111a-1]EJT76098.1 hypothetical protein GGTG_06022 [Gaeumannomyces tritici R3-111a-1]
MPRPGAERMVQLVSMRCRTLASPQRPKLALWAPFRWLSGWRQRAIAVPRGRVDSRKRSSVSMAQGRAAGGETMSSKWSEPGRVSLVTASLRGSRLSSGISTGKSDQPRERLQAPFLIIHARSLTHTSPAGYWRQTETCSFIGIALQALDRLMGGLAGASRQQQATEYASPRGKGLKLGRRRPYVGGTVSLRQK